jgi:pyridoxal phosphate enzyme (YggS family)
MYRTTVEESLPRVRERIERAASRAGRSGGDVRIVAVTKGHPLDAVHAALDAGLRDLGENRVEELERKVAELGPDARVTWHMIGHLQSRKAGRAIGTADLIHSVDSVKLARRLSTAAVEAGQEQPVLVQVNVSGEDTKSGFTTESAMDGLAEIAEFPGLRVDGMMTMAPFVAEDAELRATFDGLRALLEKARQLDGRVGRELSMGMSNDFEIAIEEGSTMVRLGTVLFGRRPT